MENKIIKKPNLKKEPKIDLKEEPKIEEPKHEKKHSVFHGLTRNEKYRIFESGNVPRYIADDYNEYLKLKSYSQEGPPMNQAEAMARTINQIEETSDIGNDEDMENSIGTPKIKKKVTLDLSKIDPSKLNQMKINIKTPQIKKTKKKTKENKDYYQMEINTEGQIQPSPNKVYYTRSRAKKEKEKKGNYTEEMEIENENLNYTKEQNIFENFDNYTNQTNETIYQKALKYGEKGLYAIEKIGHLIKTAGYVYIAYDYLHRFAGRFRNNNPNLPRFDENIPQPEDLDAVPRADIPAGAEFDRPRFDNI
jgi:hypothetical protein